MRKKKTTNEEEAFRIANVSKLEWVAEKNRAEEIFNINDDDEDDHWLETEELSKEEKMDKLRHAEKDVKFERAIQKSFRGRGQHSKKGVEG